QPRSCCNAVHNELRLVMLAELSARHPCRMTKGVRPQSESSINWFVLKLGIVPNDYLSRELCLFDLAASPNSISRRIASEREGLSLWCLAQVSIADLRSIGRRTVRVGSCPVAGRPRPRFFCVTGIDSLPILCDT